MHKTSVSVIVPTYQPQEYIKECLSALNSQTLDRELYEVIIILNGCDEPYKTYLHNIIDSMTCKVHMIHTMQGGVSNARNLGIDAAEGEYLFFQDDDDYITSNYLEAMLQLAAPDVIPISNAIAFEDKTRNEVPSYRQTHWYKKYSPNRKQPYYNIRGYFSGPWMKLIHRDIVGNRRYDTRFDNGEDGLFNFLISDRFNYVDFAPEDVIYYRRYRDSSAISKLKFNRRIFNNNIRLMKTMTSIYLVGGYNTHFYLTRMLAIMHTLISSMKRLR